MASSQYSPEPMFVNTRLPPNSVLIQPDPKAGNFGPGGLDAAGQKTLLSAMVSLR
jgi:hypothetical protein